MAPVPKGFASWDEVIELQGRMNAAADRISSAEGAEDGLGGIVADPDTRRLAVYWKGTPPTATTQLIDKIRASLPVDLWPARYSDAELTQASWLVAAKPGVTVVSRSLI